MSKMQPPKTIDEAWELFNGRRFTHGHRESHKESFAHALKGVFDAVPAGTTRAEDVASRVVRGR
jgi:hypothetical protein